MLRFEWDDNKNKANAKKTMKTQYDFSKGQKILIPDN